MQRLFTPFTDNIVSSPLILRTIQTFDGTVQKLSGAQQRKDWTYIPYKQYLIVIYLKLMMAHR